VLERFYIFVDAEARRATEESEQILDINNKIKIKKDFSVASVYERRKRKSF
jgi:hypothetical protein